MRHVKGKIVPWLRSPFFNSFLIPICTLGPVAGVLLGHWKPFGITPCLLTCNSACRRQCSMATAANASFPSASVPLARYVECHTDIWNDKAAAQNETFLSLSLLHEALLTFALVSFSFNSSLFQLRGLPFWVSPRCRSVSIRSFPLQLFLCLSCLDVC